MMLAPTRTRGTTMQCPRCQKLTRDEKAAEAAGDRSTAVDCRVLIGRHDRPQATPTASKAKR